MAKITRDRILKLASNAKKESKHIDFKERFDVNSERDWCELIKDITALANSGGGGILIGVRNNGKPSGFDIDPFLCVDPAVLTDKVVKYTGEQFSGFDMVEIFRGVQKIALFIVDGVSIPMVFMREGGYLGGDGKRKIAFNRGTVYFRHGAKSEPGNSDDLRRVVEQELERIRDSWLSGIKKVVEAPPGHNFHVLPPNVKVSDHPAATPIRISDDDDAPIYRLETPNDTHIYRQKDVVRIFNESLGGSYIINGYDIQSVRRVYKLDKNPSYYYRPRFGSPQYSKDFVNWLIGEHKRNDQFFSKARQKYKKLRRR